MVDQKKIEEVKQEYISIMGEELGKCFYALWNEVAHLYAKWQEYVNL